MNLILRLATIGDAELLFDWRNAPQTRANSVIPRKWNGLGMSLGLIVPLLTRDGRSLSPWMVRCP